MHHILHITIETCAFVKALGLCLVAVKRSFDPDVPLAIASRSSFGSVDEINAALPNI